MNSRQLHCTLCLGCIQYAEQGRRKQVNMFFCLLSCGPKKGFESVVSGAQLHLQLLLPFLLFQVFAALVTCRNTSSNTGKREGRKGEQIPV